MLKCYSVLDVKACAFSPPMCHPNNGTAIRSFSAAARNPEFEFNKFPEDFVLYEIGAFDPDTGFISSLDKPLPLCKALDFIEGGSK